MDALKGDSDSEFSILVVQGFSASSPGCSLFKGSVYERVKGLFMVLVSCGNADKLVPPFYFLKQLITIPQQAIRQ